MKVGIVGENINNDSKPMKALLEKRGYDKSKHSFISILKNIKGSQLDNIKKVAGLLKIEKKKKKLDFIIYLRDLDALPSNSSKISERKNWFFKLDAATGSNGLLFIIIYELEALIYADIETFNRKYKTDLKLKGSPLFIEDPKGKLIAATKGKEYKESQALDIFQKMSFQTVYQEHANRKHPCFQKFIKELDDKLKHP